MGSGQLHRNWTQALAIYLDRRLLVIFAMGISSGMPLLLSGATLGYWLAKVGVDKTTIGLFALVGLPYSLKFLWAPLIDQLPLPGLTRIFGRRRAWALVTQGALVLSILWLASTNPAIDPWMTAAAALAVAFASASQDIVIDAYRIDVLEDDEQGAGAAMTQYGYRVGLLLSGAGALALADFLAWETVFMLLIAVVALGMVAVLLAPEPENGHATVERTVVEQLNHMLIEPFSEFIHRRSWLLILGFVLLYKYGDAISGVMANPFYVELGFTGAEIGSVTKVFGMLATLAGVFAGGVLIAHFGIMKVLVAGGILQALTNLTFAWLAWIGPDLGGLALAVGADNFTGGLGSTAFVAYLSSLCLREFSATQFALLTSFMAFGRTAMSAGGGWLADQLDWVAFFTASTLLAIPGLILLWLILRRASPQPDTP